VNVGIDMKVNPENETAFELAPKGPDALNAGPGVDVVKGPILPAISSV
jgi:hypothetical protein